MSLSPENKALMVRVLGYTASPPDGDLDMALDAARREGERKVLGHGSATLRDQFAMAALPTLLSGRGVGAEGHAEVKVAIAAYMVAEAMMAERAK